MKLMRKYRGTNKVLIAVTCSIMLGRSALSLPDLDENKLNVLAEMSPTDTIVLIGVDKLDLFIDKVSEFFDREAAASELVPDDFWSEADGYIDGVSNGLDFNILASQSYDRIGLNINSPFGFAITSELPLFFIPINDIEVFHGYLDERSPFSVEIYNNIDGVQIFHTSDESPLFWIDVGEYLVATATPKENTPIDEVGNFLIAATERGSLVSLDAYRDTTATLNNEWELAAWFSVRTIADVIPAPRRESGSSLSLISEVLSIDSTAMAVTSFDGTITHESVTNFNRDSAALNYLRTVDQNASGYMNPTLNVSSVYSGVIRANWPELLNTLRSFTPIRNNLTELQESMTNETGFNLDQIAEFWPTATGAHVAINDAQGLEVWSGGRPNGNLSTGGQIVDSACPTQKERSGNNVIDLNDGTACILSSGDSATILFSTSELFGAFIDGPHNESQNQASLQEILTMRADAIVQGQDSSARQPTEGSHYLSEPGLYAGHLSTSLLIDSIMPMLSRSVDSSDPIIQMVTNSLAGDASARLWLENDLLRGEASWRSSFDNTSGFGLATVGAIAAIGIPNFITMQYRAKRAEVPTNVSSIRTALINYESEVDAYTTASPHPEGTPDANPRIWSGGNTGFNEIGWAPDGNVRGQYWVTTNRIRKGSVGVPGSDFTVWGRSDIDNDGIFATYTATRSINTLFLNNNDTY